MAQMEKQFDPIKVSLVSALGNWVGDMILYPLDTISTRLKGSKHTNHEVYPFIKNSIKTDGRQLYRGILLSFPYAFIPTALYLYIYENLMRLMSKTVDKYTNHKQVKLAFPFFISSFAELVCLYFYLPVDTVRTRIQMNRPQYNYSSLVHGIREINAKEGFWRLYKSSKIYLTCKILYTSIQFQSFEMVRYYAGSSYIWMLLNTILSTAVATTLLNPLQVLITRYALVDTTKKKLIFTHMVKRMYKREGLGGFYKGYATELVGHVTYALFWLPLYQIFRQQYGVQISQ